MASNTATRMLARPLASLVAALLVPGLCAAQPAEPKANYFDDPFLQVTAGIDACGVPEGPLITETERRAQSHYRADRGVNCYQAGRCRLPNSYLYDKEIIPRVKKAIEANGRFAQTSSVWPKASGAGSG